MFEPVFARWHTLTADRDEQAVQLAGTLQLAAQQSMGRTVANAWPELPSNGLSRAMCHIISPVEGMLNSLSELLPGEFLCMRVN